MNEKPLERLNYYNGRPLDATDLKTEQEYHIRTRRWLNKSLYTAGIARGLEVREVPGKRHVIVSPGLALDSDGREIILLEETDVEVCSYAGNNDSTVVGNYLVIEYSEETLEYEKGGCVMRTNGTSARKSTSRWGGPSRIEATPEFSWVPFVPPPGSNQIVLARVELRQPNCDSVHRIDAGARRDIGAASAAKVRQYALEGERHIDANNPGTIYFNIRGRQPNSVSLCLRSEKFSTLYYTELGNHSHALSNVAGSIGGPTDIGSTNPSLYTGGEVTSPTNPTQHTHDDLQASYFGDDGRPINCFLVLGLWPRVSDPPGNEDPFLGTVGQGNLLRKISSGTWADTRGRPHSKPSFTAVIQGATQHIHEHDHTHSFTFDASSSSIKPAGIWSDPGSPLPVPQAFSGRGSSPLTYVDNLQVFIGPDPDHLVNRTADIRRQLQSTRSQEDWSRLGGGSTEPDHAFIKKGTGLIRLDFLPNVSFAEGEYVIQLKVASGGGRIHYNLYVE